MLGALSLDGSKNAANLKALGPILGSSMAANISDGRGGVGGAAFPKVFEPRPGYPAGLLYC